MLRCSSCCWPASSDSAAGAIGRMPLARRCPIGQRPTLLRSRLGHRPPESRRAPHLRGHCTVAFILMSWARQHAVALIRRWIDPLPLLGRLHPSHLVQTALGSADGLSRPPLLAAVLLLSVVMWVGGGLTLAVAVYAYHLPVPLSAAFLLLVVTNSGYDHPLRASAISGCITACIGSLPCSCSRPSAEDQALSYAVAVHALAFGGVSLTGLFFLWVGHYRLDELVRRSRARMSLL